MATDRSATAKIIMTATAGNGDRVELLCYGDETFGLRRNGVAVDGTRWPDVGGAIEALMRLTARPE